MLKKFSLKNKYSLITGAAGLLGGMHAHALAEINSNLILTDLNVKLLLRLKKEILKSFPKINIFCFKMDITKHVEILNVVKKLKRKKINIDVLINNADLNSDFKSLNNKENKLENFSLEYWEKNIRVGLTGTFLCSKIIGTDMSKRKGGVILNISSDLSVISPNHDIYKFKNKQNYKPVSYSTVKTGIVGLTKYIATYWAKKNIRCNALSPGGVYNKQDKIFINKLKKLIPMNRMANKNEYISTVQYLCTDASSYLTGQNIVLDGGRSIW
tara:strand:- start:547 stop:1356 length:810 start_codon:yes stop_codon:yes gene_type:complete